jgi:hypothetical protein
MTATTIEFFIFFLLSNIQPTRALNFAAYSPLKIGQSDFTGFKYWQS